MNEVDYYVKYYFEEAKRGERMSKEEAEKYYAHLCSLNRIISIGRPILGLLVSWRLTEDQIGKIERDEFLLYQENITEGPIVYVQDWWVKKGTFRDPIRTWLLLGLWSREKTGCEYVGFERFRREGQVRLISYKKAVQKWIYPLLRGGEVIGS